MDVPEALVEKFVGFTNAAETVAAQLLIDAGLDLEAAVASFFAIQDAGGAGGVPGEHASNDPIDVDVDEDEAVARALHDADRAAAADDNNDIRAPLPQVVDTLLPDTLRARNVVVDNPFVNGESTERGAGLAAMYRPPVHLTFSGSFDDAMRAGQTQNRWLLVNIQRSDVFACHIMNRDVWADNAVQELLEVRFVFWQRDEKTPDGARYKQFYRFEESPHVAIIDPRSGERVAVWGGDGDPVKKDDLLRALSDFTERNSLEDDCVVVSHPGVQRPQPSQVRAGASASGDAPPAGGSPGVDAMEMEDAQLAAAIAASMEDTEAVNTVAINSDALNEETDDLSRHASRLLSATDPTLNRDRSLRAQQDSEFQESLAVDRAKEESEREEAERMQLVEDQQKAKREQQEAKRRRVPAPPPQDSPAQTAELAIRLPSGKRLQRRFYTTDTMRNVYDYVETECDDLAEGSYELMSAYPRRTFTDPTMPLDGLGTKAALVVHLK